MDIVNSKLSSRDHGNWERGYYRAPVKNEDVFDAIDELNAQKSNRLIYDSSNKSIKNDKIDHTKDEVYIARKRGYYDKFDE